MIIEIQAVVNQTDSIMMQKGRTLILWLSIVTNLTHGSILDKISSIKFGGSTAARKKALTLDTISSKLIKMEYAVRGAVVDAADKISEELKSGNTEKYPFGHIIYTNIG